MNGVVRAGWAVWRRNTTLWTGLYLAKLLLVVVVVIPVMSRVNGSIDNSLFAKPLLSEWSLDVIGEILVNHPDLFPAFVLALVFFALIVFFAKQFANGGIYVSLYRGGMLSARSFFGEAGAQFGGNLKITVLMIPVYIALALVAFLIVPLVPKTLGGSFQNGALTSLAIRMALLWVIFIPGGILSDLLRLNLAARPEIPIKQHWHEVLRLYRRRFVKLNGLYYLYFIPFVAVWLIAEKLALVITGGLANLGGVMIELALFQTCSWLRTGQSLLFTSTAAVVLRAEKNALMQQSQGKD